MASSSRLDHLLSLTECDERPSCVRDESLPPEQISKHIDWSVWHMSSSPGQRPAFLSVSDPATLVIDVSALTA